jgi:hypothetical protein
MCPTDARCSGSDEALRACGVVYTVGGESSGEGVRTVRYGPSKRIAAAAAVVAASVGLAASSAEAAQRYAPVRGATPHPALGVAAAAGNPSTFLGTTSQFPCQMSDDQRCGQVNVFMTKDLKRVKSFEIGFEAPCDSPDHYYGSTWEFDRITPRRSKHNTVAKFGGSSSQDDSLEGGLTAHDDTILSGKLTRGGRGSGTFQTTITIRDQSGQTVDTCSTGALTYHVQALNKK